MKRALITGASGFVGANLVRRLLADGHDVHLLMRPRFQSWRLDDILTEVSVHQAALHDPGDVRSALSAARPEWIFHLAAHGAYSYQTDLQEMLQTNVTGTATLLTESMRSGFDAFINTGSSSEYGFKDHAPTESEWLEPNSNYAATKASATLFCSQAARNSGAPVTTLRLYSAYGPWEEPSRLMPTLVTHGLAGRLPPLASPSVARDYVYVDDVVDAYISAAEQSKPIPGAVYNVGTGVETALSDLVAIVREELHIQAEPQWSSMEDRAWDTSSWVSDSRHAYTHLGWRFRYTVREGFRLLIKWLRASEHSSTHYNIGGTK